MEHKWTRGEKVDLLVNKPLCMFGYVARILTN